MKKLRVTVDGKVFDVSVEVLEDTAPTTASATAIAAPTSVVSTSVTAPSTPPATKPSASAPDAGVVASPLAGKVVSVDVQSGQVVKEGQQVLTLEAMKMNTFVYAPKTGTVGKVYVVAGDAVDEGAALLALT